LSVDSDNLNILMNDLISNPSNNYSIMGTINSPGKNGHGKYFIDVLSIHRYPQLNNDRSQVIANPADMVSGWKGILEADNPLANPPRKGLIKMITESANTTNRNASNLTIALTEYNIEYLSNNPSEAGSNYTTIINGADNRSFIHGQWVAEMMAISMGAKDANNNPWVSNMNLWSIKEGDCNKGFGYISNCSTHVDRKRPAFHHFSMMANNFKGTFYPSTASPTNLKAFASKSTSDVVVMLLNQNTSTVNYTINLNGSTGNVNFSTGIAGTYGCEIPGESTSLLRFDHSGILVQHNIYRKTDTNGPVDFFNTYNHTGIHHTNTSIGNATWNTLTRLKGTITVNGILNINANVEVAPGTIIIVNGTINIGSNAEIKPIGTCSGPWQGLQVNLGGVYNMNESAILFKP
jgi:hypothetical protein